jgi:mRNA interferase MazF
MREIKRGDIYKADLSTVVGSEQGGIRPLQNVQNDMGNRYSPTIIVVPITTRLNKTNLPTQTKINKSSLLKESIALMEQIRTIDKCRLKQKLGYLTDEKWEVVNQAIKISLGLA